jgi:hypothetical protein
VGAKEGFPVGTAVADGAVEGTGVTVGAGDTDGKADADGCGVLVGAADEEGCTVAVGCKLGSTVLRPNEGSCEGAKKGLCEGLAEGTNDGPTGATVGVNVVVGAKLGVLGKAVGNLEGVYVCSLTLPIARTLLLFVSATSTLPALSMVTACGEENPDRYASESTSPPRLEGAPMPAISAITPEST